jgi:hypothetical protein
MPAIQPVIEVLSPPYPPGQATGGNVDIHGHNIRDASIPPNQDADGTVVRLVKGSTEVTATYLKARPNDTSGRQVVRIKMPGRSATPWGPQEQVTLRVEFGEGAATKPYKYDD